MSFSSFFARIVALVGGAMIMLRRWDGPQQQPVFGVAPAIPKAVPQNIPTLKMPTARGWQGDEKPIAAPGLKVNAFARGLTHPRQVYVLPNGDVLASESMTPSGQVRSAFDYAIVTTMRRARASGTSPNRIMLLRDADGDGVAEIVEPFLINQRQPYGMALKGDTFYVGNTDAVWAFPYTEGARSITASGTKLMDTKTNGHWTRDLLLSKDASKLYVSVGSQGNIDETASRPKLVAPASTNSIWPPTRAASTAPVSATRSAWPGNPLRIRSLPWSTSGTASATKCRPTI